MRIVTIIWISVVATLVSGCAKTNHNKLRQGGITSAELYRNARGGDGEAHEREQDIIRAKSMIRSEARHEPYTRNALNETEQLFKLLPNPKITIYVYPHISTRENAPIPGYATAVSLYQRDEYALPTEVVAQGAQDEPEIVFENDRPPVEQPTVPSSYEVNAIRQLNQGSSEGRL